LARKAVVSTFTNHSLKRRTQLRLLLQQKYQRQRYFTFNQIGAGRLTQHVLRAGKIQHVIDQLKRDTQVHPIAAQHLLPRWRGAAQQRTDFTTGAEKKRRLASDDIEVLLF